MNSNIDEIHKLRAHKCALESYSPCPTEIVTERGFEDALLASRRPTTMCCTYMAFTPPRNLSLRRLHPPSAARPLWICARWPSTCSTAYLWRLVIPAMQPPLILLRTRDLFSLHSLMAHARSFHGQARCGHQLGSEPDQCCGPILSSKARMHDQVVSSRHLDHGWGCSLRL